MLLWRRQRLANRAAMLGLLAVLLGVIGVVLVGTALAIPSEAAVRVAAATPLAAAGGVALWARSVLAEWRRLGRPERSRDRRGRPVWDGGGRRAQAPGRSRV